MLLMAMSHQCLTNVIQPADSKSTVQKKLRIASSKEVWEKTPLLQVEV